MAKMQCPEALGRRFEFEAFSRCPVVGSGTRCDLLGGHGCKIGFARQCATHAQDCVFNSTFLPGRMRIAEEGLDAELVVEFVVFGELGTVVEGDGTPEFSGQRSEQAFDARCDVGCVFAFETCYGEPPGCTFVHDEDVLAVLGKRHQIGLPVAWLGAAVGGLGALGDGATVFECARRAEAAAVDPAASAFGFRQKAMPPVFLCDSMIYVTID